MVDSIHIIKAIVNILKWFSLIPRDRCGGTSTKNLLSICFYHCITISIELSNVFRMSPFYYYYQDQPRMTSVSVCILQSFQTYLDKLQFSKLKPYLFILVQAGCLLGLWKKIFSEKPSGRAQKTLVRRTHVYVYTLTFLQNKPKILHENITHRYYLYLLPCKIRMLQLQNWPSYGYFGF